MSRIGNKQISVPKGVSILIEEDNRIIVKGPKGELTRVISPEMKIDVHDNIITVERPTDNKVHKAMHGLTRSLVANMVEGVTEGFKKDLELHGVGYRAQKSGDGITIQVGYSKPVEMTPPNGISLVSDAPNRISVLGIDKELVGEFAAKIRAVRRPDPYLGKGIRYAGENIRRKAGKAGKVGRKK